MRTLNDIVPPSRRKESEPINLSAQRSPDPINLSVPTSRFPRKTIYIAIAVIIIAIGALFYFSAAGVRVIPNSLTAQIQNTLTATNDSVDLPFKIITIQKIASSPVKGSGTKAVTSSASGSITIYNTQSSSQKLITNTRFATADGLTFRIHSGVTIPGGSTAKPGSISAKVYADKPGSAYNIGPMSFIVPGFVGTAQEGKVYAKSSTAMTGGASGNVPVVDPAIESTTRDSLHKGLESEVATNLKSLVPDGYILLDGASVITYQTIESQPSTDGMVDIKEQGTATAVVFPNGELAKAIALSLKDVAYHGEPVTLAPDSQLALASIKGLPIDEKSSFTFTINGTASLIYTVDPTRIAVAVSGKSRSDALVALKNYPEVAKAFITLRPIWRHTMPQDPASINVSVDKP